MKKVVALLSAVVLILLLGGCSGNSELFFAVEEGNPRLSDEQIREIIKAVSSRQYDTYPYLPGTPVEATLYKDSEIIPIDLKDAKLVRLVNFYYQSVYYSKYSYTQGYLDLDHLEEAVYSAEFRLEVKFVPNGESYRYPYDVDIAKCDTMIVTNECFVLIGHDQPGYGNPEGGYPYLAVGHYPLHYAYSWLDLFGF